MSDKKNNFELELNDKTVILHLCPNRDTVHVWNVFGSFAQWQSGQAPLYDSDKSIIGYTDSLWEYVTSICKYLLYHEGKSLVMGFGHIDDFQNNSTELFRSYGVCPIAEANNRNNGWKKWQ